MSRLRPRAAAALTAALTIALAHGARANGRFPQASQLVVDPRDPAHLVVRATYGLLESRDGGASFAWICEAAVGYSGVEDPSIAVTADGTLLAGVFEGLARSHDHACSWSFAGAPLAGEYVVDVAIDRATPSHAFALTSTGTGTGAFHDLLVRSLDDGRTWRQAGAPLDDDLLGQTLDVAPSDSARVYVTAVSGGAGVFVRSNDGGASWTRRPLELGGASAAYVSAIDPRDADHVYLRLDGVDDRLVETHDGGGSFTTIYAGRGEMLGFALSPDGARVAVGGPEVGVLVAPAASPSFVPTSTIGVECLTWTAAGLYACAREGTAGFTLGVSLDEGASFTPLHHLADACPLACAADAAQAGVCAATWGALASTLGRDPATCGADAGAPAGDASSPASSCGLRRGPRPGALGAALVVSLVLAWSRLRRARRRDDRSARGGRSFGPRRRGHSFGPSL